MAVQKMNESPISYGDPAIVNGLSVFSKEFDEAFYYAGEDLGCRYTPNRTEFVLWAPTAEQALVQCYDSWDGPLQKSVEMVRGDRGVWRAVLVGSWENKLYTYKVKIGESWNEAVDPYARAVSVNGDRGVILDMGKTNPARWTEEKPPFEADVDAVIYEVHVRDLTIHPESGAARKGTFLGACEEGIKGPAGIPTGLDHIASLGVTHVEFLPIFDYSTESVDETRLDLPQYNWGYDPKNYNAPEGSYATDPFDPSTRIRELKTMIQDYHDRGLRVIMDVVYNHVYDATVASFAKLVPGYYFRYKENGELTSSSGCGNDTASEKRMMRKFIVDSVIYWAREYHIDGFRFDLMGLHDVETMREVRKRLDEIDPSILIIGEGWVMGAELPEEEKANQQNAAKLPRIGQFNDKLRDALKGSVFSPSDKGWVGGQTGMEQAVMTEITGSIGLDEARKGFAREPSQSVAYVEAHDNHTLWDRLLITHPDETDEFVRRRMHLLATAVVLTSQGIVFLHAGQEFMRTKSGVENSYNAPDEINRLDWERCSSLSEYVEAVRTLIGVRRAHPGFRLRTAEEIRRHLKVEQTEGGCLAFTIRDNPGGDSARHLFVVHNANRQPVTVNIPLEGLWTVEYGQEDAGTFDRGKGGPLTVNGISTVILGAYDAPAWYHA